MVVCGRYFSKEMIRRIQERVNAEPDQSRRQLARHVCEWLEWRTSKGGLQEGSCRKALAIMGRGKVLELPERRRICQGERKAARAEVKVPEVRCSFRELGDVTVTPILKRESEDSSIARELLQQYHPLGTGKLRGAQMRYVVESSRYGYLGVLTFSSGTWALAERDKYIGWSEGARRSQLGLVVRNDRFLILPTIGVRNLASHVLGIVVKRLRKDWQERYGVSPLLVETFIDSKRHAGTCYQAANWKRIGQTSGRRGPAKAIFVYPLSRDWRKRLCAEPPPPVLGESAGVESPGSWVEEEFGRVRFYDQRLKQRLYRIAENFSGCSEGQIPQASGRRAEAMGAYRFFHNPKVTMDVLLTAHTEASMERIRQHRVVLVVQDTTSLNYNTHPMRDDFGPIGTKRMNAIGLLLHDTMAFSEQGTPLGIVDAQCWSRDPNNRNKREQRKQLPIEQKESRKWLRSFRKTAEIQKVCPDTKLISIGDRESDIYELFQEATGQADAPGLLVRLNRSSARKLDDGKPLWDTMKTRPIDGTASLRIPRSGSRKQRDTILDIRFAEVTIQPPQRLEASAGIRAWAVYVREQDKYATTGSPIEWMLLTTVAVNSFQDAGQRVEWYRRRWGIEIYHRTLKSGCRIQNRHLDPGGGLKACVGIDMVVAWRVFHLTMLSRETPDAPCTEFFTQPEAEALCCYTSRSPRPPKQLPTLAKAAFLVASMGGYLGRKCDGNAGTQSLWRGLQKLEPAAQMYLFLTTSAAPSLHESGP
jgi:hypothetical protein